MLSQAQVDLWRESEQVQGALLHCRQRGQIHTDRARWFEHGQRHAVKRTQHHLGCRACGRPRGVAGIESRQPLPLRVQLPPHKAFIQQLPHVHPPELGQQQRYIIDSFVTDGKLLAHVESLPQFSKTAQANERTVSS